jgi:hypothetical protein
MNTHFDALAADIKRSMFNPPIDPHRDTAKTIIARSDLRARRAEYEALCGEFGHLVQDIQLAPDAVFRDLLLGHADYRLDPIAVPAANTLEEAHQAIAIISTEIGTLKRRIATLKADESDWARTPLEQREWQLLRAYIMFDLRGAAPEHKARLASAAERALKAGYVSPRDTEREKLQQVQMRETARALAPPMATGVIRQRQPAAVSHGVPNAPHAKPLPAMTNAVVIGTAAEAFARGESLGDILNSRPILGRR